MLKGGTAYLGECVLLVCFVVFFFPPLSLGLFEVRALEYLESIPETEPSGMNKILRSLGKGTPFLMCVCGDWFECFFK